MMLTDVYRQLSRYRKGKKMKKTKKAGIITCLTIAGIIVYIIGGCTYRHILKERNEEIMDGYPDEIKAYLEEKYGREFCVAPKWTGGGEGSPVPFAPYTGDGSHVFRAWENEEDGYAFWTSVHPISLEDRSIKVIKDNYCWKFISDKIKEELRTRLEGIIDECKIIACPGRPTKAFFGEKINEESGIKEAMLALRASEGTSTIWIRVYISPEIQFDEDASLPEIEKIVKEFYKDCFPFNSHILEFRIQETQTGEDYLMIEPEKSEQYLIGVKKSEYGDDVRDWIPVRSQTIVDISIEQERIRLRTPLPKDRP